MNLLVHMDARGTSSVYPHLGIEATRFNGEMKNPSRQRAIIALAIGSAHLLDPEIPVS
jgi:hypothetical protein